MSGSVRDFVLLCAAAVALSTAVVAGQTVPPGANAARNPFAAFLTQKEPNAPALEETADLPPPPDLAMETIVLKFLEAKSLKSVLDRTVTPYGTAAINEKTNSVVLCDTRDNLAKILAQVQEIDQTPRQIMIEVVIMDVKLNGDTEVGVNLQVSAIVTDGNNIFLTVDAEQNVRTGESAKGVPVVDTRRATTALLLQNDQTIVIGGLRRSEKTKEVSQIPLLGDLPLIGLLFRSTAIVTTRSELVGLLSPHICKNEPIPPAVSAERDRLRGMSFLPQYADQGPKEETCNP
jgi:type II secretory pathway component GspD/PulD (secretin)